MSNEVSTFLTILMKLYVIIIECINKSLLCHIANALNI